ncbi:endo alpha-1,4 polygalactosaminidase [Massilia sp. TW-1]|uniref:Endo alpha-1,4 polygalactosaminidase n=2 Tax=Telluria antibiotica TaxID=2717319 RepID=A0ABX0PFL1_9BURK|nr:endo alpha-1,4 polygalactosaminidase [Telluria antibiotica]NIA56210.1 endo alpha-1,4 polygalactosaminidase [Telluria antibiotica]
MSNSTQKRQHFLKPRRTTSTTATETSTATTTPTTDTTVGAAAAATTYPSSVWVPTPGTSFQIQFSGTLNTSINAKMYDIDASDTSATAIASLKAKGIKVICYFSAGSYEDWREDAASFPASVLGNTLDGWPDERWLDIRQLTVLRSIMGKRMDMAASKGCDGVDPDNVDSYTNDTGFPLTAQDQLDYNKMIAQEAHNRNLSVGLKNDIEQVKVLAPYFDFAINEECFDYNECGVYTAFTGLNKAVFGIEYSLAPTTFCPKANAANMDFLKKRLSLDAYRVSCR